MNALNQSIIATIFVLIAFTFSCVSPISGKLFTPKGFETDFSEARVNIVRLDKQASTPYTTFIEVSKDGEFRYGETLEDGEYIIEALVPGFKPASKKILLKNAASENIRFKLDPLDTAKAPLIRPLTDSNEQIKGQGKVTLTPPQI